MSVGLHILYGVMGAGKTNYAVNVLLKNTKYKKVICNVPLNPDFMASLDGVIFDIKDKYKPLEVIDLINQDNPSTLFIVDESQLCLTSSNVAECKRFAKKMSQIRQDDQDVILIAQTSKMLPTIIKAVATDCYLFENKNVKGIKGESKVKTFLGGNDYSTKLLETFTYKQVFGNYDTSNWESTETPKNLFFRTYIKMALLAVAILLVSGFVIWKFYSFFSRFGSDELPEDKETPAFVSPSGSTFADIQNEPSQPMPDTSECVRSFNVSPSGIVYIITDKGKNYALSSFKFVTLPRCPLP